MSIQVEHLRKERPFARIPALQEHAGGQVHTQNSHAARKQGCGRHVAIRHQARTLRYQLARMRSKIYMTRARVLLRAVIAAEHRASAERYGARHGPAILLFSCALFLSPRRRTSPCLPSC